MDVHNVSSTGTTSKGKHKALIYESKTAPGCAYTFTYKSTNKTSTTYRCNNCEIVKKKYRMDNTVPIVHVKDGRFLEDPEEPANGPHFCLDTTEDFSLFKTRAVQKLREFYGTAGIDNLSVGEAADQILTQAASSFAPDEASEVISRLPNKEATKRALHYHSRKNRCAMDDFTKEDLQASRNSSAVEQNPQGADVTLPTRFFSTTLADQSKSNLTAEDASLLASPSPNSSAVILEELRQYDGLGAGDTTVDRTSLSTQEVLRMMASVEPDPSDFKFLTLEDAAAQEANSHPRISFQDVGDANKSYAIGDHSSAQVEELPQQEELGQQEELPQQEALGAGTIEEPSPSSHDVTLLEDEEEVPAKKRRLLDAEKDAAEDIGTTVKTKVVERGSSEDAAGYAAHNSTHEEPMIEEGPRRPSDLSVIHEVETSATPLDCSAANIKNATLQSVKSPRLAAPTSSAQDVSKAYKGYSPIAQARELFKRAAGSGILNTTMIGAVQDRLDDISFVHHEMVLNEEEKEDHLKAELEEAQTEVKQLREQIKNLSSE
uniref:FLYWCH-type domain-containing protein n=1 Tax=Steinernema glaseri TaxID=37863 RepID=A0A1I8APX6_9BILA